MTLAANLTSGRSAIATHSRGASSATRSCIAPPLPAIVESSSTSGAPRSVSRRDAALLLAGTASLLLNPGNAHAIQGYTAGRIPGVVPSGQDGFNLYTRPEGKQGGHGIGWSEISRYNFKVPTDWEETPVSIADLGGTELDLRFSNTDKGSLFVVVAPVLRFRDVGFNADVSIDQLAAPDTIIAGFGPELFGVPLEEGAVIESTVATYDGTVYYQYVLKQPKPHVYVSATAVKNRVFILCAESNGRQFRKGGGDATFRTIMESFRVPKDKA